MGSGDEFIMARQLILCDDVKIKIENAVKSCFSYNISCLD